MKKEPASKIKYRLEIVWSPDDESYVVNVPELPGCMTHGATVREAVDMAAEAIGVYIDSLKARKLPVPVPFSEKKFSGKIPLRIEPALHRNLMFKAELAGVSLNKFIETKLKKAV